MPICSSVALPWHVFRATFGFHKLVRVRSIEIESVDLLDFGNPTHRFSPERGLSLECVEHDALQQIAEGEIVVLGERLQHFDQALLHADAGLDSLNCYHGTMVHKASREVNRVGFAHGLSGWPRRRTRAVETT